MSEPADIPQSTGEGTFDYPVRRVEEQSSWHSKKATWNKRRYYTLEIATLAAGALIPIVNVWGVDSPYWMRVWSAVLGSVVVLAAGLNKLFKFQENWLHYRAVTEALKRERELFGALVGDYADQARRNALLVERTEALLSNVTTQFVTTHRAQQGEGGTTK